MRWTLLTAKYPHLFGATNDFCNVYSSSSGNTVVFKVFNARSESGNDKAGKRVELTPSGTWSGKYANADWQAGKAAIFQSVTPDDPTIWAGKWNYNWEDFKNRPFYIGGVYFVNSASNVNDRRLTGKIYAVRIYKRSLTDAELEHNRIVDEARFFGNPPASNVTVALGRYDASTEAVGDYLVEGTYTFSAGDAVVDGKIRRATGCKIEAWDGSAWGTPTYISVPSYTYTEGVSPAKMRLTWQWAGDGTVLIVR